MRSRPCSLSDEASPAPRSEPVPYPKRRRRPRRPPVGSLPPHVLNGAEIDRKRPMDQQTYIHTIAVVGAGRMGGPIALNLRRAGFGVVAYDTSASQLGALARQGVTAAASAQAAAGLAEIVIVMLPSDDTLQQVVEGPGG